MKWSVYTLLITSILLTTGCALTTSAQTPNSDDTNTILTAAAKTVEAGILSSSVPSTPQATETPIPTMPPTPTPDLTQPVTVLSPAMNLRSGPGTLFDVVATFSEGTVVYATGMTPAGDWLEITAPVAKGQRWTGWLAAAYLDTNQIESALPIISWPVENTLQGRVTDTEGSPINDIRVAANYTGEQGEIRAEGVSNREGNFYIYLPSDLNGTFDLEIVAVNCNSTIAEFQLDGTCQVEDYFPKKWRATTIVPQTEPVILLYERAAAYLEGKVVYQDGNGASQILVKATRQSDDVESEKVTPQGGAFKLPLGIGTWEVTAVRFLQDGTPLISEIYTYQITNEGQQLEPLIIPYTEIIER